MNTLPNFFPIKTPIKQNEKVMANILKQTGKIDILKKAKLTPTARASMLVAIDNIKISLLSIVFIFSKYFCFSA